MLRRASTADLTTGRISRADGYVVVVMRFYPRFLAKDRRDEYLRTLAPEATLFAEFKREDRRLGDHDGAFAAVDYEGRFWLAAAGRQDLARLVELASTRDVYLVCQCETEQRCHGDLLLLMAHSLFGAELPSMRQSYPVFCERLAAWTAAF
jgi:uncharacterized protein YeaO (DUF488 family)